METIRKNYCVKNGIIGLFKLRLGTGKGKMWTAIGRRKEQFRREEKRRNEFEVAQREMERRINGNMKTKSCSDPGRNIDSRSTFLPPN
jgi:hypothetical protein